MKQQPIIAEMLASNRVDDIPDSARYRGLHMKGMDVLAEMSQVFLIEHVRDWCRDNADSVPELQDMPLLVPPYENCIFELGRCLVTIYDKRGGGHTVSKEVAVPVGVLMLRSHDMSDEWRKIVGPKGWRVILGWFYGIEGYASMQHGETLYVREDGSLADASVFLVHEAESLEIDQSVAWTVLQLSRIVLFAVGLLNCKNVEIIPRKTRGSKRRKKGKKIKPRDRIRCYTMQVHPMRKQYVGEGETRPGGARSFHMCRGHFKDFRTGPGLFGKHRGVYWWEAQARGSKKVGVVEKDYQVETD